MGYIHIFLSDNMMSIYKLFSTGRETKIAINPSVEACLVFALVAGKGDARVLRQLVDLEAVRLGRLQITQLSQLNNPIQIDFQEIFS